MIEIHRQLDVCERRSILLAGKTETRPARVPVAQRHPLERRIFASGVGRPVVAIYTRVDVENARGAEGLILRAAHLRTKSTCFVRFPPNVAPVNRPA